MITSWPGVAASTARRSRSAAVGWSASASSGALGDGDASLAPACWDAVRSGLCWSASSGEITSAKASAAASRR